MEDKIKELVNEINRNAGEGYNHFEQYNWHDIVASKEALRLYAAKILAASLLDDEEDYVFNMQAEFGDYDYPDEVTIKVSETWTPPVYEYKRSKKDIAEAILFGAIFLFIMGAGIYKIYEWVK